MPEELKPARLEARLPESILATLRHAASLQGRSLSDFVVTSAREAAERAIREHEVLSLSVRDQEQFAAALLDPPAVAEPMARAIDRHHDLIEPS